MHLAILQHFPFQPTYFLHRSHARLTLVLSRSSLRRFAVGGLNCCCCCCSDASAPSEVACTVVGVSATVGFPVTWTHSVDGFGGGAVSSMASGDMGKFFYGGERVEKGGGFSSGNGWLSGVVRKSERVHGVRVGVCGGVGMGAPLGCGDLGFGDSANLGDGDVEVFRWVGFFEIESCKMDYARRAIAHIKEGTSHM